MTDIGLPLIESAPLRVERTERIVDADDRTLLERFQRGENAALVELFDRHNRRLLVYAQKVLGDADAARDLVQEVWLRTVRLRERPRRIDNPVGFLLRIARNLCLTTMSRRRGHASLDAHPELAQRSEPGPGELAERAVAALESLPFDYREVLVLTIYCGYSTDEVARMLERSPEAIWKRASRARAMLRAEVLR